MIRWGIGLVVVGAALSVGACKTPKAGDPCSGDNQCTGPTSALVCVSGRYAAADCKGPDACTKSPFRCDYRGNATGDVCFEPQFPASPMTCTPDKKARVQCSKSKVERDECDGPKACSPKTETTMLCDHLVRAGAACGAEGDWCSTDGADWLQCKAGKMVVAARCRGPAHCKPILDAIACDNTIAEVGDPCFGTTPACSGDKKQLLACKGGTMTVSTTCPAGQACAPGTDPACK